MKGHLQGKPNLKADEVSPRNPLIIVKEILKAHSDEELVAMLKAHNKDLLKELPEKDTLIRVKTRKRARNDLLCSPIFEVSPPVHQRFTAAGTVFLGLQRRTVEDVSPLVQCSKCLGYAHTRTHCKEPKLLCSFCGGEHTRADCERRLGGGYPGCINCIRVNLPDTAHSLASDMCPERRKWDNIARSRVNYCC